MDSELKNGSLSASIRKHLLVTCGLSCVLIAGVGGWAAYKEISGAVVAGGIVVADGNTKHIQHREGGIVDIIHVREGDQVEVGDLLLSLDSTATRTAMSSVTKQLDELYSKRARLIAERDGHVEIDFDRERTGGHGSQSLTALEIHQAHLLVARRNSLDGRKQQLLEQIRQFEKQIDGINAQRVAKEREIELIQDELNDLQILWDKELVHKSRLTALRRDKAQLRGEHGGLIASIAQANEAISERRILIIQVEENFLSETLELLETVNSTIAQLEEQSIAAKDRLSRDQIRSSYSGTVHDLDVHTVGGVVTSGQTMMQIVPGNDPLVVEVQVPTVHIDRLSYEQDAAIRFPSFDQRTTPELGAKVVSISPDLIVDEKTGLNHYRVRLSIEDGELDKLNGKKLVPGMPVETFIRTGNRTVLSYLVKPMSDQLVHALRES